MLETVFYPCGVGKRNAIDGSLAWVPMLETVF